LVKGVAAVSQRLDAIAFYLFLPTMLANADPAMQLAMRFRIEMLSLVYRYLICLFCIGAVTAFAMAGFIIYLSALIGAQLLF
jgi:hypothetical protein